MPYSLYDQTMRIVQDCGAKTIETNYTDSVELTCRMLEGAQEPLLAKMQELFRGKDSIMVSKPFEANF